MKTETEKEYKTVSVDELFGTKYGGDQHPNKPGMDGMQHAYRKLIADGWTLINCADGQAHFERAKKP